MDMRILKLISVALTCFSHPLVAQDGAGDFCFEAPHDQLCAAFPQDVPDFSEFFEYMVISAGAQAPFDSHAWQAFVALNWPELDDGPAQANWRDFHRPGAVLGLDNAAACAEKPAQSDVLITSLEQSDGNVLVDRNGNYILYETRINAVARDYILRENLHRIVGQKTTEVNFPRGRDADTPASVILKTAWTVLSPATEGYITASGRISVPAERSLNGVPICLEHRLGLVGMHIVTKVASGNGDEWIWATFEHRSNAPVAVDARNINSIYGKDLFPEGCVPPEEVSQIHLLFDAGQSGPANTPPQALPLWSPTQPHAVDPKGQVLPASQATRCWRIFASTEGTNARWQRELRGTPLENYMLISAQWRGANISPYLEHGELPRFLSNTTMETYLQTERSGTCLGCHAGATTAAGTPSDFTFILSEAHK